MSAPLVVSIGMTHPRNVAGLGRDARVAAEYGVSHAMAVSAVSAQDEQGVHGVFAVPPDVLRAQLGSIDFTNAAAVRVGALGNAENALALCDELAERVVPIVFDPVARASDGGWLYRGEHDALAAMNAIVERLHPIITPNIAEAGTLGEVDIWDLPSQIRAGSRLIDKGAASALVKGGHVPGDPVDVLVTADNVETFSDTRLPQKMRGTGCTLAMALACEIALGRDLVTAVKGARAYVRANIARS